MKIQSANNVNFERIKLKGKFYKFPELKRMFSCSNDYLRYYLSDKDFVANLKTKSFADGKKWMGIEIGPEGNGLFRNMPVYQGIYATEDTFEKAQERIIDCLDINPR